MLYKYYTKINVAFGFVYLTYGTHNLNGWNIVWMWGGKALNQPENMTHKVQFNRTVETIFSIS